MTIPYQKKERVWHDPDQTRFNPLSYLEPKYIAITMLLGILVYLSTYGFPQDIFSLVFDGALIVFLGIFLSPMVAFAFKLVAPK